MEREQCQKCLNRDKNPPHPCPFKSEVFNDNETTCECCDECTQQCADEV